MKQTTKDNYESIAKWAVETIAAQEGDSVSTDTENPNFRLERKILQLSEALKKGEGFVKEGLLHFAHRDASRVNKIIERLQKSEALFEEGSSILSDQDYDTLMDIALRAFDEKDYEPVQKMLSVITLCFPNRVQPYILLATTEWAIHGIHAALLLYEQFLSMFDDPLLCYYAADCYQSNGVKDKARLLLQEGLSLCKQHKNDPSMEELHQQIDLALQGLN